MMMSLKRVTWKRDPTEEEYEQLKRAIFFGPSVFERGREWLFLWGDDPEIHADTPPGYRRIN